jgi:hypothetical protein
MKLADKTVYLYGSIDTNFDPSLFSLDSTFEALRRKPYNRLAASAVKEV